MLVIWRNDYGNKVIDEVKTVYVDEQAIWIRSLDSTATVVRECVTNEEANDLLRLVVEDGVAYIDLFNI